MKHRINCIHTSLCNTNVGALLRNIYYNDHRTMVTWADPSNMFKTTFIIISHSYLLHKFEKNENKAPKDFGKTPLKSLIAAFLTLSKSCKGFSKASSMILPSSGRTGGPGGKFFGLGDLSRRTRITKARHSRTTEISMVDRIRAK